MSFSNNFTPKSGKALETQFLAGVASAREALRNPPTPREPMAIISPALLEECKRLGIIDADGRIVWR